MLSAREVVVMVTLSVLTLAPIYSIMAAYKCKFICQVASGLPEVTPPLYLTPPTWLLVSGIGNLVFGCIHTVLVCIDILSDNANMLSLYLALISRTTIPVIFFNVVVMIPVTLTTVVSPDSCYYGLLTGGIITTVIDIIFVCVASIPFIAELYWQAVIRKSQRQRDMNCSA